MTTSVQKKMHLADVEKAKAICKACPSLTPCRTWSLAMGPDLKYGVSGGLTATERKRILKRRRNGNSGK